MGWAIAHAGPEDRATRFWCLTASLIPDIDGISLLGGVECYQRWHHILAHNVLFGAMVVAVSTRWIGLRPWPLTLVAASFLSHLVGDYFGSGPGWSIHPYLPFNSTEYLCAYAWELASWQNFAITLVVGAIALEVAFRKGRTPLEFIHAGLERSLVDTLRLRRFPKGCAGCGAPARGICAGCGRPICSAHIKGWKSLTLRCADCPSTAAP